MNMNLASFWPTVGAFTVGLVLLGMGFSLREKDYGVFMLWAGVMAVFALIVYNILQAIGS